MTNIKPKTVVVEKRSRLKALKFSDQGNVGLQEPLKQLSSGAVPSSQPLGTLRWTAN